MRFHFVNAGPVLKPGPSESSAACKWKVGMKKGCLDSVWRQLRKRVGRKQPGVIESLFLARGVMALLFFYVPVHLHLHTAFQQRVA